MSKVPGTSPKDARRFFRRVAVSPCVSPQGAKGKACSTVICCFPLPEPESRHHRKDSGGWVGVGIPRIIALLFLNKLDIKVFNNLSVLAFALSQEDAAILTRPIPTISGPSFQPHDDYRRTSSSRSDRWPFGAGTEDEVFRSDRFAGEFSANGKVQVFLSARG